MLTLDRINQYSSFITQVKNHLNNGDNGSCIAALAGVDTISPVYGDIAGMMFRYCPNRYAIGVNKKFHGYLRLFLILHEVFHIILLHVKFAGFLASNMHADYEILNDRKKRKLVIDTEMEANLMTALVLFDDSILEDTGYELLQKIKDTKASIRSLDKSIQNIRHRWSVTREAALLSQIQQYESSKCFWEEELDKFERSFQSRISEGYGSPYKTVEEIAVYYQVPVDCIKCYLEVKRIMGYSAIPRQDIDCFKMFDMSTLKPFEDGPDHSSAG